jgi:hypothetical protein
MKSIELQEISRGRLAKIKVEDFLEAAWSTEMANWMCSARLKYLYVLQAPCQQSVVEVHVRCHIPLSLDGDGYSTGSSPYRGPNPLFP